MAKRYHKPHRTAMEAATRALEKAERTQCMIIYAAAALALRRYWHRGRRAILNIFNATGEIWQDCVSSPDKSMLAMCEQETGIEVQCGDGRSWHDISYFNGTFSGRPMTFAQWTYMRQQQLRWVAPQIVACFLLTLHRKYKFGYDRCARFYEQIDAVRVEYNMDPERLLEQCRAELRINIHDVVTGNRTDNTGQHGVTNNNDS